jgi:PKD repeat protein
MVRKSTIFQPGRAVRHVCTLLVMLIMHCVSISETPAQTLTELVVPQYFGSKSAGSTNNSRTPFALCLRIDGLLPNTLYDIRAGIGLVSDGPTAWGAGNLWTGTDYTGNIALNVFTTDSSGSSGPFWLCIQPTGNAARFDAGQQHNLRIGYRVNGGSFGGSPAFVGTKIMTALDIATNPRTAAISDDGCFVKGTAMPVSGGKYVLLYDNENGTGDPLSVYMIRQMPVTQVLSQPVLPQSVNDIYLQSGTSGVGDYPAVIPAGIANPAGLKRVESRNNDNSIFAFNTDADGLWPGGANSTGSLRRELLILTGSDTPLIPGGPVLPTVLTDTVISAITFNSATGGGNVTDQGGDIITARGLCWSESADPSISDDHTNEPGTAGSFSSTIAGLMAMTSYHLRAYATNSAGTAYGEDVAFTTACEPYPPVTNFYSDKTEIQVGDTVNFFDSTFLCPDTWNWSFVGGIPMTSTLQNPVGIVYTYPGEFNVCLTTANSYGSRVLCKSGYIRVEEHEDPKVVITEIMYNPPESGTDSLEFIELYNNGIHRVNLKNFFFDKGVNYVFPEIVLEPGGYLVVAADSIAVQNAFEVPSWQWTSGALSNVGEEIILRDRYGYTVDSVMYDDAFPWDSLADGNGSSLELCDPGSDNSLGQNWRGAIEFRMTNNNGDSLRASPLAGCSYYPVPGFTADDSLIFTGEQVVFTSTSYGNPGLFHWTFEGGTPGSFDGEMPPPVRYDEPGSFGVSLTVTNAMGSATLEKPGMVEVGLTGIETPGSQRILVCPNPSPGGRIILGTDDSGPLTITLFNCIGARICSFITYGPRPGISLPPLSKGLYYVEISGKNEWRFTQKLIIN